MKKTEILLQLKVIFIASCMPILVFNPVTSESCHSTILMELMQCVEPTESADDDTKIPIAGGGDPDLVESACRNGTFLAMTACVKTTLSKCSEDTIQLLNKFLDPEEMNISLSHFCNNTSVYRKSAPCLREQDRPIRKCINQQVILILNALRVAGSSMERRINGVCSGYTAGVLCIDQALRPACGDKIADVIKRVNGGQCLEKAKKALSSSETSKCLVPYYIILGLISQYVFVLFTG